MPEAFSPVLNLLTRNPITPEEERTAQAQIPGLLAKRYGVRPDCVAVGASATDVLAAVANSFEPRSVAVPVPSRAAYERCLGTAGHRIVEVPGPDGFVVPDPQAVRRMGLSFDAAMLANPAFPHQPAAGAANAAGLPASLRMGDRRRAGNRPDVRRRINGDHDR